MGLEGEALGTVNFLCKPSLPYHVILTLWEQEASWGRGWKRSPVAAALRTRGGPAVQQRGQTEVHVEDSWRGT